MYDSWSSKTDACEQLLKQSAVSGTLEADLNPSVGNQFPAPDENLYTGDDQTAYR